MSENEDDTRVGRESGKKSPYLSRSEGGVLDTSEGYEPITEGVPEKGIFTLVGGYLDPTTGKVHSEVELRALSGHEEDLLSNDNVTFFRRMRTILSQCCTRIGDLTQKQDIIRAIHGLPAGSRQHLLICLRRTSHWRTTKDIYEMSVDCPNPKCGKRGDHKIDLSTLKLFEMPDPYKRTFEGELPSGQKYSWTLTDSDKDEILTAVLENEKVQNELLSWSIMIRLNSLNGETMMISPSDVLDPQTHELLPKMGGKASAARLMVKNLSTDDRTFLREEFMTHEPGIDTDLEMSCPKCKVDFGGRLDLGQRSFFFPSARRSVLNRKFSI